MLFYGENNNELRTHAHLRNSGNIFFRCTFKHKSFVRGKNNVIQSWLRSTVFLKFDNDLITKA